MEKLKINDSYDSKLDTIIKRSDNELNKGKLIKVLLFRQFFKFLKTPKSYTANIYGRRRIKEDSNKTEVDCPEDLFEKVDKELVKAQSEIRYSTSKDVVSESKILPKLLINKMLYEEICSLYDPAETNCRRYKKCDFREIKSILTNIIDTQTFPANLDRELKNYDIDKEHLIYYMMLSVQVPESMTFERMLSEKFIKGVINIKVTALEKYITEAQEGIKYREILDILLQYNYADLISYQIRQSMKENPNYLENVSYKSVGELKKEIRRQYKEEQEYY